MKQTFLLDMLVGLYNEPFKLGVRERMENCKIPCKKIKQLQRETNTKNKYRGILANYLHFAYSRTTHPVELSDGGVGVGAVTVGFAGTVEDLSVFCGTWTAPWVPNRTTL
jgi:hypothetical protein